MDAGGKERVQVVRYTCHLQNAKVDTPYTFLGCFICRTSSTHKTMVVAKELKLL